jgi:hypothetical protein
MKNSILDYVTIVTDKRLLFIDFSKSTEKLKILQDTSSQVKLVTDKLNEISQSYDFINMKNNIEGLSEVITKYTQIFTGD